LNDITIQPWPPIQYGFFEAAFLDNPKFPELNQKINAIAAHKGVTSRPSRSPAARHWHYQPRPGKGFLYGIRYHPYLPGMVSDLFSRREKAALVADVILCLAHEYDWRE
jgi:hypothetical protein